MNRFKTTTKNAFRPKLAASTLTKIGSAGENDDPEAPQPPGLAENTQNLPF